MQQLLNDMAYYRSQQLRNEHRIALCKLIILVTLCLTAYSCALNETHSQPTTAKEANHGM